ncbi:ABC transporter permease [Acidobacteriota bacterium]
MKKEYRKPPRIAGWFIRRMFPDAGGCSLLGDMTETYRYLSENNGPLRARIWFWIQSGKALFRLFIDNLFWRIDMLKNYLLVTLRNIRKNSTFSFLNIIGLAIGMTAFILIVLYVQFELSFDTHFKNTDRIYRIVRDGRTFTPPPLGPELAAKIPEVETVARLIRSSNTLISIDQDNFLEEDFYWAEPETFKIFSIPFIYGDPTSALNDPSAIVLSRSTAEKYFGNEDPIGKVLTVNENLSFNVSGVFEDIPANTHFGMDVIVPFETSFRDTNIDITSWMSNYCYTYFLLHEGADPQALAEKLHPVIEAPLFKAYGAPEPYPKLYFPQPITEIHLHSHRMQEIQLNNDIRYIILFASIAFLILFIACINYMNLATARSLRRAREVGMRKVVGAQKGQLISQFLGESVVMAALAMALAIFMVNMALPSFNSLVERHLGFNPIQNPQLFLGLALITLFVGVLAGSYPAMRMSGFKPISVLSGVFSRSTRGSSLRNVLVLIQFSITIILIVCTLAVRDQLKYIKNMDVGYTKEQIITLPVRGTSLRRNIQSIKTELLQSPNITAVSASARLPNDIDTFTGRDWIGRETQEPITIFYNTADYDYIDLFGIQIVEGRNFSRDFPSDAKGAFLVNETAVKVAEWDTVLGREMTHYNGRTGQIVGVMKDFHLRSLHSPIEPLYVMLNTRSFSNIAVKVNTSNIPGTIDYMEGVIKRFSPNYPFSYSFFDEVFERAYFTEQRLGRIFSAFAVLAIFIACLGLFGLTAFAAEQRTKEIGIRKVLGATDSKIFLLLSKEFIRWVLLANIFAWPIAYYAMNKWLQNFTYRIEIGILAFLISGGIALLIAYLTVSYQSVKSALTNPVDSLRYQ